MRIEVSLGKGDGTFAPSVPYTVSGWGMRTTRSSYAATVQVNPQLGVPCGSPGAEPRWSSQSILYVMLDENGDVPTHEQLS